MEIEFNVDRLIQDRGLNIVQAAALCGLSYPTTYAIARNHQARVDLHTLSRLADGLGVGIQDLFREKNPPPAATDGGNLVPGTTPE